MKKLVLFLALVVMVALSACSSKTKNAEEVVPVETEAAPVEEAAPATEAVTDSIAAPAAEEAPAQ
jgi:outer membrane murein-binding lipoprotein Lpp